MINQVLGGLRRLKKHFTRHGSALVSNQSGNVFTMLFGAVALTGVLAGVGMQTITGPVTTITRVTQKNITDTHLLTNASIVIANAIDGDFDNDGIIEPAEYMATGTGDCMTAATGGGCLPTTLGATRTDPWGTMYSYCVWDHGSVVDARNDSGAGSTLERLQGTDTSVETRPVIALISAGPNKSFETTCAAYDGSGDEGVVEASGSDDFVYTRTYAEASASGGGLWQLKPADADTATIEKDLEIGTGATQVTVDRGTGIGSFIGVTTNSIASRNGDDVISFTGGLLPDVKSAFTTCGSAQEGVLRINDDTSGEPILEICDGAGTWNPISGEGTTIDDDGDTFMLVDDGSGGDNDLIRFYAGDPNVVRMTIGNDGSVSMAGTLAVTSNATIGGTLGVTGATTLSSTLDAGASTLASVDVTGNATVGGTLGVTGVTTLSDAATVGGTLGVTGATTLSSTLGVTGATTLSSTLDVTGDATMNANAIIVGDLTVDTDTLFVDSADDRVGIGTLDPLHKLHVVGGDAVIETEGAAELNVVSTDGAGDAVLGLEVNGNTWQLINDTSNSNELQMAFNNSMALTIEDDGSVGIGTSSPDALLDVDGGVKIGDHTTCAVGGGNNGTMRFNATDDIMQICVDGVWQGVSSIDALNDIGDVNAPAPNGDEVLAWDAINGEWVARAIGGLGGGSGLSGKWEDGIGNTIYYDEGNVGIGTDAPISDALTVLGDIVVREDDNGNAALRLSADNTNGTISLLEGGGVNTRISGDSGAATFFNAGNVGIGTQTPGARLEVAGGIKFGQDAAACTGAKAGTIRYDNISNKAEICDGSNWLEVSAGAGGGGGSSTLSALTDTDIGAPLDRQVLTYDSASGDWIATNQLGASNVIVDVDIVGANVIQTFNTNGVGGSGVETFMIGSDRYLIFAESYDGDAFVNQTLYKKAAGATQFTVHQIMPDPTNEPFESVYDWEYVQIGSDHYLMVAQTSPDNSQLYKWNSGTELFETHQSIPEHNPGEIDFFQLGGDTYMTIPNYNDGDYVVDLEILRWNSSTELFEAFQSFPAVTGAYVAEFFTIGADHFLCVGGVYDGDYNTESAVFRWNGTNFDTTPYQLFPDPWGVTDCEVAQFDGKTFLAFASLYDTNEGQDNYIYQWNPSTTQFDEIQTIQGWRRIDIDYHRIQGSHFLLATDYYNGSHNSAHTRFYKYNDRTGLWDQNYTWNSGNSSHGGAFFEEDNRYFWIQGEYYDGNYQTTSDIWELDTNITNVTVEQGVLTTGIPNCSPGQVLTGSYGTFQCVTGGGGAGGSTVDGDGDTRVQVEESADEDKIRFDTANIERMIIDTNGNIGIGTSDPRSVLHVIGGVQISDDNSACNANKAGTIRYVGGNLQLCNSSNTWQTIATGTSGGNTVNYMVLSMGATQTGVGVNDVIAFDTVNASNGSDISHSGNQFTLTAGKHYQIESDIRFFQPSNLASVIDYGIYDVTNSTYLSGTQNGSASTQAGWTDVSSKAIVSPTADTTYEIRIIGIGSNPLDALGGSYSTVVITELNASTGGSGSGGGALVIDGDSDTRINVEESPDEDMIRFDTAGDERMIIVDTGEVGIGTSTPAAQLDVVGGIRLGDDSAACTSANDGTMRYNDSKLQICVNELWTDVGVNAGGDGFDVLPAPGIGDSSWPDVIRCIRNDNGDMRFYHFRYRNGQSDRYHYTSLDSNQEIVFNPNRTFFNSNAATDCDNRDIATLTTLGRTHNFIGGPQGQIETGWPDVIECLHSNSHVYLFYYYYKSSTDIRYYRLPGSTAYMQYDPNGAFNTASTNGYDSCEGKPINQIVGDGQGYNLVGGTGAGAILADNIPDVISCTYTNGNTVLFYSHQYDGDGTGTYHYYADMHTAANYIRFFNSTQRYDNSYGGGNNTDCRNMSYQELYEAGKAFDILNDDGGPVGGTPQAGDFNDTGDGYFVVGWPDALKCSTTAHPQIVLMRGEINSSTTMYVSPQGDAFTLTFNTADRTYNTHNSNMNGSDCLNKSITQLETDNQAFSYRDAAIDPAQSVWNGVYPDAIVCERANGDKEISWLAHVNVNHIHYGRGNDTAYYRWNVSDLSYSTQSGMHSGTDCENRSLTQLIADGSAFNLVGGADTGSMVTGLPDAIICKDTVDGHERPFFIGHVNTTGTRVYYYDRLSQNYSFYTDNGNYWSASDTAYDCTNKSLSQLKTDGRAIYLAETGNADILEEADHDGGSSMVPGWPDAIVCHESDDDPWVYWFAKEEGDVVEYFSYRDDGTYGRRQDLRFNKNGSYNSNGGASAGNCIGRSITELLEYGQAFNLLGGGGISVRAMVDQDGDTMIQIEESADEDFIRFDTGGLERVVITDTGNVGIGTPAPAAMLDVAGAIKLGDDGLACAPGTEGAMRYETTNDTVEVCDGTNWIGMGGSGATSLVELTDTDLPGTPSQGDVLTYNNTSGLWEAATYAAGGSIFTTQMDIVSIDSIQSIPTHGAQDWEAFTIDGEQFLAVANYHDGGWNDVPQSIYKWDGTQFASVWSAADRGGVSDWEYFQIGSKHYVVMVEQYEGNYSTTIQHELFEWNGTSFTQIQTFDLNAGLDAEHMTIGGEDYLFFSIYRDDSVYTQNSKLYKWNSATEQFEFHQDIPTLGAFDAEHFNIGGTDYMLVANYYDGSSYNLTSPLYEWDAAANSGNGGFVEVVGAGLSTNGALDIEYFAFGGDHYVAVADYYNGSSSTIPVRIYRWNGSSFTLIQDDMTYTNSYNLAYFEMGSDHYLVTANYATAPDIAIHKWNGTQFQLIETIDTGSEYIYGIEHFEINGVHYLAEANYFLPNSYNRNSDIWRLNTVVRSFEVTAGVAPSLVPTCTAGQVATADGTTFTCVDVDTDKISDADGNTQIQVEEAPNEDKIRFDTAGVERVIIDDAGNVGIGTTNPAVDLDVEGGVQFGDVVAACDASLHGTIRYNGGAMQLCDNTDQWVVIGTGGSAPANYIDAVDLTGSAFSSAVNGTLTLDNINACSYVTTPMNGDFTLNVTTDDFAGADYVFGVFAASEVGSFDDSSNFGGMPSMTESYYVGSFNLNTYRTNKGGSEVASHFMNPNSNYQFVRTSGVITFKTNGTPTYSWATTNSDPMHLALCVANGNAGAQLTSAYYIDETIGGGGGGGATQDADSDTRIQVEESADEDFIRFDTAGDERMVITDTGMVGIGTDAPATMLDVTGGLRIGDDSAACTVNTAGVMRYNSDKLQICTNEIWTDVGLNAGDGDSYALLDPPTIGDPSWPDVIRCNDASNGVERFFYFEYRDSATGRYRYNDSTSDYYIDFNEDETYHIDSRDTDCRGMTIDDLNAISRTHQFIGGTTGQMIAGWPDVVRCQNDAGNQLFTFYHYHRGTSNERYYRRPGTSAYMQYNSDGTFNTSSSNGYGNCEGKSMAQLMGETVPLDGRPATYNLVGGDGAGSMFGTGIPDVVVCTDQDGYATAYYSYEYQVTSTYHYYAAMRNDTNRIIRFFNATQRYDESYGPTTSDCDGLTYADLYQDGQAFDLVNDIGGPMSGVVLDGEINDAATGYMVKGWPDFITCTDVNGYEYRLGRGNITNVGVTRYNTRYSNSYWIEFNADKTHSGNHSTLNGADCDNLTIAQLESANLAHALNDGSGSSSSMISGWPDAIVCNETDGNSGNKYIVHYAFEDANYVWYAYGYDSGYIRYNKGDQSWNADHTSWGDCDGRSITALGVNDQTFDLVGGTKDGSMVAGWPDAILCRDTVEGHVRPFYLGHFGSNGVYTYYYDYNGHYYAYYTATKNYYTTNDSNYDCANDSIQQLVSTGKTRNFVDTGNVTLQEPAQHSGGGSMVDGWPDAIVCREDNNGDYWVFWYAWQSGTSYVRYISMVYSTTYYHIDFELNKEWSGYGGVGANNCIGHSISELQEFGQAFDLVGGGGISVRNMTDQDGDTQIHIEKTSDDDTIRFDTVGLERMTITDTGSVGIGTMTPVTKLEVDGGLRIGDDAGTCNAGYSGTMRYTDANGLEICDGLLWGGVTGGPVINALNDIGDVDAGAPTDRQVLAWNATDGEWEARDVLNGGIIEYTQSISGLTEIQSDMPTHWGYGANSFVINNETYLVFSNDWDGNASDIPQRLFKWNGLKFVQHQLFDRDPGQAGSDFGRMRESEYFSVGGNHYLLLMEYEGEDNLEGSARTFLHKWNTGTEQFDLTQTISIAGNHGADHFTIAGDTYVAFASYYNGTSYALGSNIYRFNATTEQLEFHQTINTVGATGVKHFNIGGIDYLAYAQYYNGSTYALNSQLHQWNSGTGEFDNTPIQTLNMNGAHEVDYTTIDGEHYLLFGTLPGNAVEVWRWNGASWVAFQTLSDSVEVYDLQAFTINNNHFLLANDYSGSATANIYRWTGTGYELLLEHIGPNYNLGGTHIRIGDLDYLAMTRHSNGSTGNINSYLYRIESFVSSFRVVPTVAQAIVPTCADGEVLTGTVSGLVCVAGGNNLRDGDGDTMIQLDEGGLDDDIIRFDTRGQERMVIREDGKIGVGTATPNYEMEVIGTVRADDVLYTSDRRYKENIQQLEEAEGLGLVETLNPVRFNWKDKERDQRDHLGLIAQEVEEILPELVGGTEEKKAVDYMGLVPVLIKAIQQQQDQIDQLNEKIEMLESQKNDTVNTQEKP